MQSIWTDARVLMCWYLVQLSIKVLREICLKGLLYSNKSLRLSTHIQASYYWLSKSIREIFFLHKLFLLSSRKNRSMNGIQQKNKAKNFSKIMKWLWKGVLLSKSKRSFRCPLTAYCQISRIKFFCFRWDHLLAFLSFCL